MTLQSARTVVLEAAEWRERAASHRARLASFVEPYLVQRGRGEKHPVHDFLFEYYSFRPSQLLKWSPGLGVQLRGDTTALSLGKEFSRTPEGIALDAGKFPQHRLAGLRELLEILSRTAARPAFHGCFGLHEWAMIYREKELRHPVPLRLSDDVIAELVESQTISCSHYDAFRFFTSAARPLNVLQPESGNRADFEQPGCIHANMDLYKWASKFYPWIGSDLIAAAFEVARQAREIDMRAAPYDLAYLGYEPIRVETAEGRREYAIAQREIAALAAPVRTALIAAYADLLEVVTGSNQKKAPV